MKKILAAALLFMSILLPAKSKKADITDGPFLRQLQQRDSVLIADQLKYGVRLNGVLEGTKLIFPEWADTLVAGVDLLQPWTLDTIKVHKAGKDQPSKLDIEAYVVVTSFEEGLFDLPGITVTRWFPDGVTDSLTFDYQQLVVKTMPVDTATFVVNEIKDQIKYPVTFKEVLPYILGTLAFAALVALATWLIIRWRRKKEEEEGRRKDPAHIIALRKLDKWRGDKYWEADKQKLFYSGVTDALREYIDARYGVSAMEMTTQEIFNSLKGEDIPQDLLAELKDLFERADFVKFAKHAADREENAATVPTAVRFVTTTYQADVEDEATGEVDKKE